MGVRPTGAAEQSRPTAWRLMAVRDDNLGILMRNTANEEVKSKVLEEWDIWGRPKIFPRVTGQWSGWIAFLLVLQEERPQNFYSSSGAAASDLIPGKPCRRWLVIAKKISTD